MMSHVEALAARDGITSCIGTCSVCTQSVVSAGVICLFESR